MWVILLLVVIYAFITERTVEMSDHPWKTLSIAFIVGLALGLFSVIPGDWLDVDSGYRVSSLRGFLRDFFLSVGVFATAAGIGGLIGLARRPNTVEWTGTGRRQP